MSTLYDGDTARWAEEQAELLRRCDELTTDDELAWLHLADEIEGGVLAREQQDGRFAPAGAGSGVSTPKTVMDEAFGAIMATPPMAR